MSIKNRIVGSIKKITRKILITLAVVNALIFMSIVGILLLVNYRSKEPYLSHNTVLVLRLDGTLPDYVYADSLASRFLGAPSQSMTGLGEQLKKAKSDKRIGAVILDIKSLDSGWGKADELREAIFDFRKSNKRIYAYLESSTNKEYYVATACNRIYVPPVSELNVNGLDTQTLFYRGALDKFGVVIDTYQIGKYKNAPEQYTRKNMSAGQREVTNSILDDQFGRYVDAIANGRIKTQDEVRALIDRAPLGASEALKQDLIDGALYHEEVEKIVKKALGYRDNQKLELKTDEEYRRVSPESLGLNQGERIAVIYVTGAIGPGKSSDGAFFEDPTAGSDTLVKAIEEARDDDSVKAIVLRVDSPGGTTTASDLIWGAVESAKLKKPIVVSMSDFAASGGYYIAANANRIIAQPSTLTGSVGVYASKSVVKGLYDMLGVTTEHVSRGKNAAIFRDNEQFTREERALFEGQLKTFYYDKFLPKVAKGRNRDVGYVDSIAQGRVWSGAQAKEVGLVDEFGGLDRAVEVAKELAKIPTEKGVQRVIFPTPRSFIQQVLTRGAKADIAQQQQQAVVSALPEDLRRALKYSAFFDRVKRGEMLAMMPFEVTIK
ncbi:MAG TPA: signal peptide peptidase SppA [Pyrinomonadaceae bacterium]|nr:signal peptide peptidase SppA [Pyrinomonadaceae bacterium]